MHDLDQWEYKTIAISSKDGLFDKQVTFDCVVIDAHLNEQALQGWQLVSSELWKGVAAFPSALLCIFKRRKQSVAAYR